MKSCFQVLGCIFLTCVGYTEVSFILGQERESKLFFERKASDGFQLRVMSWNVKQNSILLNPARQESFGRIVRAISPDVICLQEVDGRGTKLSTLMQQNLPLEDGRSWHIHVASDNAIISRFPLQFCEQELPVPFPLPGIPNFHYFDCFRFVSCLSWMVPIVYAASSDKGERVRCVVDAVRVLGDSGSWYRIR